MKKNNSIKHYYISIIMIVFISSCSLLLKSDLEQDLVISLGRHNSTQVTNLFGASGGKLNIPVLISDLNQNDTSESISTQFTLSTDADLATTADNISLGVKSISSGSEIIVEFDVDSTVIEGSYTLFAAMTASDSVKNNNTSSISVVIGTNLPNLVGTSLTSPGRMTPGGELSVSYRIKNSGYANIAKDSTFNIRFTVPLNGIDTDLGNSTVTVTETIYPQEEFGGTVKITMPTEVQMESDNGETDLTIWSDTLTAVIDSNNSITESNEADNNTQTVTINSASLIADLIISDILLPTNFSSFIIGNSIEATVVVQNNGFAVGSGYGVTLFADINNNGVYNQDTDVILHSWISPASVPYDQVSTNNKIFLTVPDNTLIPTSLAAGNYNIGAIITGDLVEWNTANNTYTEGTYDFFATVVDLEAGNLKLISSDTVSDGSTISIKQKIINNGDNLTDNFDMALYISSDTTFSPSGDTLIDTKTITEDISSGTSILVTETFTISDTLNVNSVYYIYCVVDSSSNISEYNESNNINLVNHNKLLIYDDEDSSRSFDVIITTSPSFNNSYFNSVIYLYSSDGVTQITSDYNSGYIYFSKITQTLSSGKYYVKIKGLISSYKGSYAISYSMTGNSYNNYFTSILGSNTEDIYESDDNSYNATEINFDTPLNRYLEAGEEDWVTFTLP